MGRARGTDGEKSNAYGALVGKPEAIDRMILKLIVKKYDKRA
jgi:hypothetical protein